MPTDTLTTTQGTEATSAGSDSLGRLGEIFSESAADTGVAENTPATETAVEEAEPVEEKSEGEEAEGAEEIESGDVEPLPSEEEADFADSVYSRYAARYKKSHGVDLDPSDPAHRVLLREVIQRGQAISRMKSESEKATTEEASPTDDVEEVREEVKPTQDSPEQIEQFINAVGEYAAKRVRPEVAQKYAERFMRSLWPKEMASGKMKVSPEFATEFTKSQMQFLVLGLNDVLPDILQTYLPQALGLNYPMLGEMHANTISEAAVERLETMTDSTGKAMYPDLDDLVAEGLIQKVIKENPQILEMRFKDRKTGRLLGPVEQAIERNKVAIKLARAERAQQGSGKTTELVKKAVATGKKQAQTAAGKAKLGKLDAGESQGSFAQGASEVDEFKANLVSGGESKLANAVRNLDRRR